MVYKPQGITTIRELKAALNRFPDEQKVIDFQLKVDTVAYKDNLTNGDRIRSMTDEEMAALFQMGICPEDISNEPPCRHEQISCLDCWGHFLRKKVKG